MMINIDEVNSVEPELDKNKETEEDQWHHIKKVIDSMNYQRDPSLFPLLTPEKEYEPPELESESKEMEKESIIDEVKLIEMDANAIIKSNEIYENLHRNIMSNPEIYANELDALLINSTYLSMHEIRYEGITHNDPDNKMNPIYMVQSKTRSVVFITPEDKILKVYGYDKLVCTSKYIKEVAFQMVARNLEEKCNFVSPGVITYGLINQENTSINYNSHMATLPYPYLFYILMDKMKGVNLLEYLKNYSDESVQFGDSDKCKEIHKDITDLKTCLDNHMLFQNDYNVGNIYISSEEKPLNYGIEDGSSKPKKIGLIDYGESNSRQKAFDEIKGCSYMNKFTHQYKRMTKGGKKSRRRKFKKTLKRKNKKRTKKYYKRL